MCPSEQVPFKRCPSCCIGFYARHPPNSVMSPTGHDVFNPYALTHHQKCGRLTFSLAFNSKVQLQTSDLQQRWPSDSGRVRTPLNFFHSPQQSGLTKPSHYFFCLLSGNCSGALKQGYRSGRCPSSRCRPNTQPDRNRPQSPDR